MYTFLMDYTELLSKYVAKALCIKKSKQSLFGELQQLLCATIESVL